MIRKTALAACVAAALTAPAAAQQTGNVIFFHPDGTGLSHWNALRMATVGPDGRTNWDRLPAMAVYAGHMADNLTGTSHGGATVHAYGVKVVADSFGMNGREALTAASGQAMSIAEEAMAAGRAVGLVQTGHIAEPGTAVFVASSPSRRDTDPIAKQVIESGATVILGGGERFLLPEGVQGRHGAGARKDGLNLIERARELGYAVVHTREELLALDLATTPKLLGVFASGHTFNDDTEEENRAAGVEAYDPNAPTIAEMSRVALAILSRDPDGFLLVAEEEGTDNLGNDNNAPGQMQALARADEAIGVFREHVAANPDTLMVMAADSEAGGLQVIGVDADDPSAAQPLPTTDENGAPYDGVEGPGSLPWTAAPDARGRRLPFAISWGAMDDTSGSILVRADGLNSEQVRGVMDSTQLYALMHRTLFGERTN
jgi:alkaline phosphatase